MIQIDVFRGFETPEHRLLTKAELALFLLEQLGLKQISNDYVEEILEEFNRTRNVDLLYGAKMAGNKV